jgi:hypothetical protein
MILRANKQLHTLSYLIVPQARRQTEPIDAPLLRLNPATAEVRGTADIGFAMGNLGTFGWIAAETKGISNEQLTTINIRMRAAITIVSICYGQCTDSLPSNIALLQKFTQQRKFLVSIHEQNCLNSPYSPWFVRIITARHLWIILPLI